MDHQGLLCASGGGGGMIQPNCVMRLLWQGPSHSGSGGLCRTGNAALEVILDILLWEWPI